MEKLTEFHTADYNNDSQVLLLYVQEVGGNMYHVLLNRVFDMMLNGDALTAESAKRFRVDIKPLKHEVYFDNKLIGHIPMDGTVGYDNDDFAENKFTIALSFIPDFE